MKAQFEKITTSKNSSFNAFIYEGKHFDAPWHFHPEFELTYILEGEGTRHVGNSVQQFETGDFVMLGSNLPHCWKNNPTFKGNAKSLVFQWNDDLLGTNWLKKKEFYSINSLHKNSFKGIKFSDNYGRSILSSLLSLIDKQAFNRLISFLQILENLSSTDKVETLTTIDFSPNLDLKTNNRIDKVYNYVQENYDKKITLDEISAKLSMGNEAFCRFFKKSLNKSFFTFINEYRINIACKMLIDTNRQVSQIAYECGYESLPFFYRQFKKFMNCSPLIYRKSYYNIEISI